MLPSTLRVKKNTQRVPRPFDGFSLIPTERMPLMSEDDIITQALTILESRLQRPEHFFTSKTDATSYLKLQFNQADYESFQVLFLNSQNGLIEMKELFRGTVNQAVVYPREVVKAALHFNAAAVILTHNHPSGCSEPSRADIQITERLCKALNLIDIRVLDHIIIGTDTPYSFAEQGLMPVTSN